jgi:hypothetical protein
MVNLYTNRVRLPLLTGPQKFMDAFEVFADGLKASTCTLTMYYMLIIDFRKLLIDLKIDHIRLEYTQVFKQGSPFKTLFYGEITEEVETQLLKFPTKASPGLER